mgnify:CR=1 FL=1
MEVVKHEEGFEKLETNPNISRKVVHLKDLMFTVIGFSNGPMKEPDLPIMVTTRGKPNMILSVGTAFWQQN